MLILMGSEDNYKLSKWGVNIDNFNNSFEHLGVLLQMILSNFWDVNINGLRGYKLSKSGHCFEL